MQEMDDLWAGLEYEKRAELEMKHAEMRAEKSMKTWAEFEEWIKARRKARDKERAKALKWRQRNGRA
jgi:hypothetical protein